MRAGEDAAPTRRPHSTRPLSFMKSRSRLSYVCRLFNNVVSSLDYITLHGRMINEQSVTTEIRRKQPWLNLRRCAPTFAWRDRNPCKETRGNQSPSRHLNPGPPKYEAVVPTYWPCNGFLPPNEPPCEIRFPVCEISSSHGGEYDVQTSVNRFPLCFPALSLFCN
jgi:hypothetical protein